MAAPWPAPVRLLRTMAAFFLGGLVLLLVVPFGIATLGLDRRQRMHDLVSGWCSAALLRLMGIRIEARGLEHLTPGQHYLVVANHQSLIDTPLLLAVLQRRTPIRFVAKRGMFRVPILGWGMRKFGHLPVDSDSIFGSVAGLRQAQAAVGRRWSTVFFAEGVRSPDGRMLPFRQAPFRIAARAGVPVLPVTIDGSGPALPPHRIIAVVPRVVTVEIHPPMAPPADTVEAAREAAEQCWHRIGSTISTR